MKSKFFLFPSAFIVFLLCSLSVSAQTDEYNYSVKNRWTVKASYSRYKTAYNDVVVSHIGDKFDSWQNHKMSNFKVETNYGINKFIELGVFIGFQHYEWMKLGEIVYQDSTLTAWDAELQPGFAPLFGVNVNFHILPFLVKSKECRWDLYLTTKYGGCYLPHKESPDNPDGKYRQEYGLGMGAGYYFKNIVGIFAESSVGQFSYFPRNVDSNFRFRIGIAAKIN
jgi:hypothetical protein